MNYFLIIPASNTYNSLIILNEDFLDNIDNIKGQKLLETWMPIPVGLEKIKKHGEFPSLSGLVTFSEKACQILKPIFKDSIELLPLQCKEGIYFLINILEKASLDFEKAEVERLPSGRIIEIDKYAFKKTTVVGKHIFVPEEQPHLGPIVSETFKETIEKNGLKGLNFKKVWEINDNE